jgi:hypothetical protein
MIAMEVKDVKNVINSGVSLCLENGEFVNKNKQIPLETFFKVSDSRGRFILIPSSKENLSVAYFSLRSGKERWREPLKPHHKVILSSSEVKQKPLNPKLADLMSKAPKGRLNVFLELKDPACFIFSKYPQYSMNSLHWETGHYYTDGRVTERKKEEKDAWGEHIKTTYAINVTNASYFILERWIMLADTSLHCSHTLYAKPDANLEPALKQLEELLCR